MSIKAKWIHLIYRSATGSRKLRLILTPIVGLSYILFASLFVVSSLALDRLLKLPPIWLSPINQIVSVPLIVAGLFLIVWSQLHFFKAKGTPVPFNPPSRLVVGGPYAISRNPMLCGIFILLFGLGAVLASISLIFIFTPLFIIINVFEIIAIEEPELEMRLGQEYLDYRQRTPMFIPSVRRTNPSRD